MSREKDTHKDSEGQPIGITPEPAEATMPDMTAEMASKGADAVYLTFLEERHRKMVQVEQVWVLCMTTKLSPGQMIQHLQVVIEKPSEEF